MFQMKCNYWKNYAPSRTLACASPRLQCLQEKRTNIILWEKNTFWLLASCFSGSSEGEIGLFVHCFNAPVYCASHFTNYTSFERQEVVIWISIGFPTCYSKLFTNYTSKIKTSEDSQLRDRFLHERRERTGQKLKAAYMCLLQVMSPKQ